MSNNRSLRAFVKYDNAGKIVPSSLILAQSMPKVGRWQEIDAYPTQSPTTTIAPGPLVGSLYLGAGYVTWLDETNRLGNMISATDLVAPGYSRGAPWAPSNAPDLFTGAGYSGFPFRTGVDSTNIILSAYSGYNNNYAAYIARNHNGGGFNDWYLPSYGDLNNIMCTDGLLSTLNNNGANISLNPANLGGIYWNTVEQNSTDGWINLMYAGCNDNGFLSKSIDLRVRAIRYFTY